MNKFLSIQEAAKCLGVCPQTLRRWEKNHKIAPSHRTPEVSHVMLSINCNHLIAAKNPLIVLIANLQNAVANA